MLEKGADFDEVLTQRIQMQKCMPNMTLCHRCRDIARPLLNKSPLTPLPARSRVLAAWCSTVLSPNKVRLATDPSVLLPVLLLDAVSVGELRQYAVDYVLMERVNAIEANFALQGAAGGPFRGVRVRPVRDEGGEGLGLLKDSFPKFPGLGSKFKPDREVGPRRLLANLVR